MLGWWLIKDLIFYSIHLVYMGFCREFKRLKKGLCTKMYKTINLKKPYLISNILSSIFVDAMAYLKSQFWFADIDESVPSYRKILHLTNAGRDEIFDCKLCRSPKIYKLACLSATKTIMIGLHKVTVSTLASKINTLRKA